MIVTSIVTIDLGQKFRPPLLDDLVKAVVAACSALHLEIPRVRTDGCKSVIIIATDLQRRWNDKCPNDPGDRIPRNVRENSLL